MTPTDTVSFFGHCHLINCAHLFFPSAPLLSEHLACVQTAEIVGCKCISAVISSLLSPYLLPYKQNDLHERISGGADKHITERVYPLADEGEAAIGCSAFFVEAKQLIG